jgi:RsmE family RNA methyltransferase
MNLILIDSAELIRDEIVVLADRRGEHIRKVLKVTPGQALRVGLLDGPRGTGTVIEVRDDRVTLACRFEAESPPPSGLSLLVAMPRPKAMKRLWPVLGAFGTDEIFVARAARSDRTYLATHWIEATAYQPLLREGLEVAGFTRLPRVRIVRRLKPFVRELATRTNGSLFLRAAIGATTPLTAITLPVGTPALIAIGPEGDWSEGENELFKECGFQDVSLGAGVLRVDTAAIAALGILACLRQGGGGGAR